MITNTVPQAYSYTRVSTDMQEQSLHAQLAYCKAYWEMYLKPEGIQWGGSFEEADGVSATRYSFHQRPAGKRALKHLRRGDHLIIDKIDRLVRSIRDFVTVREVLRQRGVKLHFVNMMGVSVREGEPAGDLVLNMMVAIAEFESRQLSDRMKRVNNQKYYTVPDWGFERDMDRPRHERRWSHEFPLSYKNKWIVDKTEREIGAWLVKLRETTRKSFPALIPHVQKYLAKKCPEIPAEWVSERVVRRIYGREKYLRLVEEQMRIHKCDWKEGHLRVGKPEYNPRYGNPLYPRMHKNYPLAGVRDADLVKQRLEELRLQGQIFSTTPLPEALSESTVQNHEQTDSTPDQC